MSNQQSPFTLWTSELKKIRTLTLASVLAAIYAISYAPYVGNFIIIRGVIEIRFGFLAIAVASMLFGPIVGGLTAVVGDFIGTLVFYGGSFFWGYPISWFFMGFAFGLFFYKEKCSLPRIIGAMCFRTAIINLLMTTYWESLMGFGVFPALFIKRLPHNLIMLPVHILLLFFVLRGVLAVYRRIYRAAA